MPTTYNAGDCITCKVSYGVILKQAEKDYEYTQPFDIVCVVEHQYLILVPADIHITGSFTLTKKLCKEFGAETKFSDSEAIFIDDYNVVSVRSRMTGLPCSICDTRYEHAEVNRVDADGHGILVCWNCRHYPYWG